jgi:GTPase SAR1 family protein
LEIGIIASWKKLENKSRQLNKMKEMKAADLKIILLGDSAVGKSKLMERFLLDDFVPQQLSTFALTLYRHNAVHPDSKPGELRNISVDFWDTGNTLMFTRQSRPRALSKRSSKLLYGSALLHSCV